MIDGLWDHVYYHPANFRFVCGDKQWFGYADSKNIDFAEIGVDSKTLYSAPISSPEPLKSSAGQQDVEEKLKRLRKLRAKDLITDRQYDEQVKKLLN